MQKIGITHSLTSLSGKQLGFCVVNKVVWAHNGDGPSGNHQSLEYFWIQVLSIMCAGVQTLHRIAKQGLILHRGYRDLPKSNALIGVLQSYHIIPLPCGCGMQSGLCADWPGDSSSVAGRWMGSAWRAGRSPVRELKPCFSPKQIKQVSVQITNGNPE